MFGQFKRPTPKRPMQGARRMGKGKPAGGTYQAGYKAGLQAAKAKSRRKSRSGGVGYGDAQGSSFGEDMDQRGPLRVGWRL